MSQDRRYPLRSMSDTFTSRLATQIPAGRPNGAEDYWEFTREVLQRQGEVLEDEAEEEELEVLEPLDEVEAPDVPGYRFPSQLEAGAE